ncbi:MAG TPA: Hsp20/alpha crystallin family protein [Ktedonobacterales bacterium]|jgi:HSP20 family protein
MPDPSVLQHILVKVYRSADRLMVATPMPGVEPEDISVEITGENRLILQSRWRGELKGIKQQLVNEWRPGGYYRELELPHAVDGTLANVTYNNGIVVVALPLAEQTRPARLALDVLEATHGVLARNAGHPVRPRHP